MPIVAGSIETLGGTKAYRGEYGGGAKESCSGDGEETRIQEGVRRVQVRAVWRVARRRAKREQEIAGRSGKSATAIRTPQDQSISRSRKKEDEMLRWALGFFIIALVAALLGFSGLAVAAAGIAKILFFIFLVLFVVTLASHLLTRT
jgi:uncharacterized membrane protein YtjA (UPF0391 family)